MTGTSRETDAVVIRSIEGLSSSSSNSSVTSSSGGGGNTKGWVHVE